MHNVPQHAVVVRRGERNACDANCNARRTCNYVLGAVWEKDSHARSIIDAAQQASKPGTKMYSCFVHLGHGCFNFVRTEAAAASAASAACAAS